MGLIRIRNLEMRNEKTSSKKKKKKSSKLYWGPSCVFPTLIAFIFLFSVSHLLFIHRTIESYRIRAHSHEDCGLGDGDVKELNVSQVLAALAIVRSFAQIPKYWPNSSFDWHEKQNYPYKLSSNPKGSLIDHPWKAICPKLSPTLIGPKPYNESVEISLDQVIEDNLQKVQKGGIWAPDECNPLNRVAIIIPYRDRMEHLIRLLSVLHPMLQRQMLAYRIFVAEQYGNTVFNKGVLMNAGFLLAMNSSGFDCVIYHDVDLIPENDKNVYDCDFQLPRHLSVAVSSLDYRLPYSSLVGGVFSLRVEDFIRVNGYSNLFYGYGGEDDDMSHRLVATHLRISRPNSLYGRYKMLGHEESPENKFIHPLLRTSRVRYQKDGLTTIRFKLLAFAEKPLYTHFHIDVGQPSPKFLEKMTQLSHDLDEDKYYSSKTLNQIIIKDI